MKKFLTYAGAVALVIVSAFIISGKVLANPSFFPPSVKYATATSTQAVLQVASATTTIVTLDSFYVNTLGTPTKTKDAVLLTQFSATSTSAVLYINYQFSQDGIDWYDDNYVINPADVNDFAITNPNIYVWTVPAAGTTTKALFVQTPTRYVRVQARTTGAPGTVWMELVGNKERAE